MASSSSLTSQGHGHEHLKRKIVHKNLSPKERDFRELSRDEQRSSNVNVNANVQLKEPTKDVENNNTETNAKRRKLISMSTSEDEQESEPKNKRILKHKIVNKNLSPKERDFRELSRDEQRSTNVNANVNVQLKEPTKDVENNNTETNTKRRKLFSTSASEDEQESEPKNKRICREKPSMEKLMDKIANAEYPFCEEVSKYDKLAKIGQGTFGEVFKARHRITRKIVALKKVLMENEKEGFPITALREIKILQLLKHENVVNLIEICRTKPSAFNRSKATFYLVFDFCEHDLAGLLSNVNVKFSLGEIKMVMKQLLNGLYFIHSNKILHRDMKAANILITKQGILKLADFGLARAFSVSKNEQPNRYTNRVVTLWYRPPELLLGERNYGPPIDMWGAGCIMAEMWTRSPIMQGVNEQHQLSLISHLCGSITTDSFSGVEKLELFTKLDLSKGEKRRVKERLKAYVKDPYALELLDKLLTIDPTKRIDSDNALNHDFFWLDPLPCDLTKMLLPHTTSMFEYLFSKKKNDQIRHAPGAAAPSRVHPANNDGQYHDRVF